MIRRVAALTLVLAAVAPAGAQTVTLGDAGTGQGPRILRAALTAPYLLVTPTTGQSDLPEGASYDRTVIVLGRDATVASTVHGDVIVVGGDLFLHPGARIDGRAIAYGGAVYNSSLAMAGGERLSFRDFTYHITPVAGGYVLEYHWIRERVTDNLTWPFLGLVPPIYDRSDGLSIPWGPLVTLDTGAVTLLPKVTYRAQLGKFDPSLELDGQFTRRFALRGYAERGTFSNDDWIYADLTNSASVFFLGDDTRNYFRADRGELTAHYEFDGATSTFIPYLGGRYERSWAVRPDSFVRNGPWSFFGRTDDEGMLRPNPQVPALSIGSALGGGQITWESQGVRVRLDAAAEVGWPTAGFETFTQTTIDGSVRFPTFANQRYRLYAHMVFTAGAAPPQRYAYIGGAGTIPTMDLLQQGGDQLLFLDSRYDIPIDAITLPLGGPPIVSLRHILGGAGVGSLPTLEQRVGLRLAVSVARIEFLVDPATGNNRTTVGLSFGR